MGNKIYFGQLNLKKNKHHAKLVNDLFDSIYKKYDLMNDVISLGSHRSIKRNAMKNCVNGNLLDLAAGTGDLAIYFRKLYKDENKIVLADPNSEMLSYAKQRLSKKSITDNIELITTHAENLPFNDSSFDNISIGFGFRNFTDTDKTLQEIMRVLKKNGKLIMIDFSKPTTSIIRILNSIYLRKIVPVIAKILTGNFEEYSYLAKSIAEHPSQEKIIEMMRSAGLTNCKYKNILNGIIAIHIGEK
jgi:demethylmenaquinone methyltransferase/2-methoxy-6-polyprenyl-1,4-benzoquinol methylase